MKEIIGLDAVKHFLELIYRIPNINGEKPPGVLIVAPPEYGKTFALTHITSINCIVVNDITGYGLEKIVLQAQQKITGYVVIPDLGRVLPRKDGAKAFTRLANILLEEGLQRVERGDISFETKEGTVIRFGIIGAMTTGDFKENYIELKKSGFLSRQIIVSFAYCKTDDEKIAKSIARGDKFQKIILKPTQELVDVQVPDNLIPYIIKLGKLLSKTRNDKGIKRATSQIRSLAVAETYKNGRNIVTAEDLNNIFCLIPLFTSPSFSTKNDTIFKKLNTERFMTDTEYYILKGMIEDNNPTKYFGEKGKYPMEEFYPAITNLGKFIEKDDNAYKIARLD